MTMGRRREVVAGRYFRLLRLSGIALTFLWITTDPTVLNSISEAAGAASEIMRSVQAVQGAQDNLQFQSEQVNRKETNYGYDLDGRP